MINYHVDRRYWEVPRHVIGAVTACLRVPDHGLACASDNRGERCWIDSGHASSTRYYLIQFASSFQDSFAAPVEAAGAELLEYLPEATFLSRIPPEQVDAVRDLPIVRWVGPYQPAYRVSENLDPFLQSDEDVVLQVRVLAGGGPELVAREAANLGAELLLLSQPKPDLSGYMRLNIRGNLVPAIAQIEGVAWVERYVEGGAHHELGGTPEVTAGSRR